MGINQQVPDWHKMFGMDKPENIFHEAFAEEIQQARDRQDRFKELEIEIANCKHPHYGR